MDAKHTLKELLLSVNEIDLYNFLLCFSSIGIRNEDETSDDVDDETDHGQIRHDRINAWIDKAIEAVYEKPEENDRLNTEKMLGLLR